jgi:hypothetical protein
MNQIGNWDENRIMEIQMNDIQTPAVTEPYYKFIRSGTLLTCLSLLLASIALIFVPFNVIHKSDGYETVLIVNQILIRTWAGVSLSILIMFFILASFLRKITSKDYSHAIYRNKAWAVAIILCALAFPINWIRGAVGQWAINPFTLSAISPVTGSDGKKYYFLGIFAGMGTQWAIAREKEWYWYGREFDLLAIDFMDQDAHVYLIRPAGMTQSSKRNLYATDTGWVILMEGNMCTAAYDTKTNRGYGALPYESPSVYAVSPFILIGPNPKINPSDLKELEKKYKSFEPPDYQNPNKKILTEALSHPNPEVRKTAKILLAALQSNKNYQKHDQN